MDFRELSVGDWLICSINITDVVRKNGIYQIDEIEDSIFTGRRIVFLSAEHGNEIRVYEKDYENEFGAFAFYERGSATSSAIPKVAKKVMLFDTMLENKVTLSSEFTSPRIRAKALRHEQEYLLDSLRTSDDLEENEKDMLRLKEIGEEIAKLTQGGVTAFDKYLEASVEWK